MILLKTAILCQLIFLAEIGAQEELLSLFDVQLYRTIFNKHYNSQPEAIARHNYFLASAVQVFTASLAYQRRVSSHYEALNYMSDLSPLELDRMLNKVMAGKGPAESGALAEAGDELEHRREKREIPIGQVEQVKKAPRPQLTVSQLIQIERPEPEPAQVLAKLDPKPESNNPNYDELAVEFDTRGFVDQQEESQLFRWSSAMDLEGRDGADDDSGPKVAGPTADVVRDDDLPTGRVKSLLNKLKPWKLLSKPNEEAGAQQLPDEMFLDLRQSGCMFQPRKQGDCGACYAFAGIAMAEFLVCNSTGKLIAFSEQYVLDCGTGRLPDLLGCDGSADSNMPNFIHNFGLELRDSYPYKQRPLQCPYGPDQDLKSTGFYRLELKNYLLVPVEAWWRVLKWSPIYVGVAVSRSFHRYAGGVDSGKKCSKSPDHAMLVVGHGREDGQEFWLLRNSFGTGWGVGGYYKLAKSAPKHCIEDQEGYVYGTRDGVNFEATASFNLANIGVSKLKPAPDNNQRAGWRRWPKI